MELLQVAPAEDPAQGRCSRETLSYLHPCPCRGSPQAPASSRSSLAPPADKSGLLQLLCPAVRVSALGSCRRHLAPTGTEWSSTGWLGTAPGAAPAGALPWIEPRWAEKVWRRGVPLLLSVHFGPFQRRREPRDTAGRVALWHGHGGQKEPAKAGAVLLRGDCSHRGVSLKAGHIQSGTFLAALTQGSH